MADLDDLARRLVALVAALAGRGVRWALRVAVVVGLAALATYLLGLAALDGPVWPVLGAALGIAAVAAPLLGAWRLRAVRRDATNLVGEVRTLMGRSADAERLVIDTVESGQPMGDRSIVVYQSQDFGELRRIAVTSDDLRSLPRALYAVTTFPGLLIIGILATLGFAFVGFIFMIALAF